MPPPGPAGPVDGPSRRAILRATAIALGVAATVLLTVVLPAEFAVDPVGTGRLLGLLAISEAPPPATPIVPTANGPLADHRIRYRADRRQLTVPSLGSVEFKYQLAKGATMVYTWRASAPVDFDFHTEPAGRPASASETFERGEAAEKQGAYTAPYDGIHGWYWENVYADDVTVTLEAVGFFSEAWLFLPNQPAQRIPIATSTTSRLSD